MCFHWRTVQRPIVRSPFFAAGALYGVRSTVPRPRSHAGNVQPSALATASGQALISPAYLPFTKTCTRGYSAFSHST